MHIFKNLKWAAAGFILCLILMSKTSLDIQIIPLALTKITKDSTAIMASLATVVIAALTVIIARETKRLRLAQYQQMEEIRKESIRPLIEIFIEQSDNHFQVFNIRVENVGKGIAQNISFNLKERKNFFLESETYLLDKLDNLIFFKKGIKALGIGKSRGSFFFTSQELYENFDEKAFKACLLFEIVCHDSEGFRYTANSVVDISEFEGIREVGVNTVYQSYVELKNISEKMSLITEGEKLNVDLNISTKNIDLNIPTKEERKRKKKFDKQVYKHLNIPTNRLLRYIKHKLNVQLNQYF